MFLVTYFAVFILSHKENIHFYSFGIEWVTDIKGTGGKIRSGSGTKWAHSHESEGFKLMKTQTWTRKP